MDVTTSSDAVVVDASASAKWTIVEQGSDKTHALLNACVEDAVAISAPPLWGYELDSVIRYRVARGDISESDASIACAFMDGVPIALNQRGRIRRRAPEIAAQASQPTNQRRVYGAICAGHAEPEN